MHPPIILLTGSGQLMQQRVVSQRMAAASCSSCSCTGVCSWFCAALPALCSWGQPSAHCDSMFGALIGPEAAQGLVHGRGLSMLPACLEAMSWAPGKTSTLSAARLCVEPGQ